MTTKTPEKYRLETWQVTRELYSRYSLIASCIGKSLAFVVGEGLKIAISTLEEKYLCCCPACRADKSMDDNYCRKCGAFLRSPVTFDARRESQNDD